MQIVKGYVVQIIIKESGHKGYLYNGEWHDSVFGAIYKSKKRAESHIREDDWHVTRVIEVEIIIPE